MLPDLALREHKALLHEGREVGGTRDRLGERAEEPAHLPRDRFAQQLLLPAGEDAVEARARDARLLDNVLDVGLRHPVAGDARVGGFEEPFA